MKKYRLALYGWEVEAVGHSLTDAQGRRNPKLNEKE